MWLMFLEARKSKSRVLASVLASGEGLHVHPNMMEGICVKTEQAC
jgi:hypothetical protein